MGDSHLYQCFPKVEKLYIGDKCSVNEECYTACSDYPNAFKPGLYCTDTTDGSRICANIHTFMKNLKAVNGLILKNVFRV